MISPHTPPGTALVVVWAELMPYALAVVKPEYRAHASRIWRSNQPHPFKVGQKVVLVSIEPNHMAVWEFAARVQGIPGSWALECFEVAVLPESLTSLLVPTKVPEDA